MYIDSLRDTSLPRRLPEIELGLSISETGVTLLGTESKGAVLEVGGGHGVAIVGLIVTGPEGWGATSPTGGVCADCGSSVFAGPPLGKGVPS